MAINCNAPPRMCVSNFHEYLHTQCQRGAHSRESPASDILNIFEMIGIFIVWILKIWSVDSVFKRFCVFSVLCVQVPEFAADDASWHSQVAPHIYSYQKFTSFCSMNTRVQIFRYMQGVWIYRYNWPNILIFCEQSGVAVPEFVRAAHLALSDPGPSNLDWPL